MILNITNFRFILSLVVLCLSGCAVQKISRDPANMMPPNVAKAVFKKYGYEEWSERPHVRKEAACGAEKVDIPFSQIEYAIYSQRKLALMLLVPRIGMCSSSYTFRANDLEDAHALVRAAVSLGSRIDDLVVRD